MQRSLGILVAVAMLAACTTGGSDPAPDGATTTPPMATPTEPGDRVGGVAVVLDPRLAARVDEVRRGLADLDRDVVGGRTLRVEVAGDPSFVRDLTEHFAADGHRLVCVLGPAAGPVVREVAPRAPGTRFCAAPMADHQDLPDNVLPVDVRVEELGYLAGVALGTDLRDGPVAALLGPSSDVAASRIRAGLARGLAAAGMDPGDSRTAAVTEAGEVGRRARELLAGGVRGLLGLADPEALLEAVTTTAVGAPTASPAPQPRGGTNPPPPPASAGLVLRGPVPGDGAPPPELLAVVEVHLQAAVVVALQRHMERWDATPASIGVAEGAIVAAPGGRARTDGLASVLRAAEAVLRAAPPGRGTPIGVGGTDDGGAGGP